MRFRIFTNDRGKAGGVAKYSALKDVNASSPETAVRLCPPGFNGYPYEPAVAIHWPASAQSDDEKAWLKRHVG
jgi:hypothetical protein